MAICRSLTYDLCMISFGFEDQHRDFEVRNSEFINRFHNFVELLPLAFPDLHLAQPADRVIYMLARTCAEDFQEILLLCGNGYGIGAEKLLRGLYERAVTLVYLHHHPEQAEDFLDYNKVANHKLLAAVEDSMGKDVFSAQQKKNIEREFQEVRDRFLVTVCETCDTRRLNHTWSKLDFVSMARTTGELWKLLVPAYYSGVREGHSTIASIFSRLDAIAAMSHQELIFGGEAQPERADRALFLALHILLIVLGAQRDHFKLDAMNERLRECEQDLLEILHSRRKEGTD